MSVIALKDNINGMFEDQCVKIYNPSEQKLIAVYKNFSQATNRLGVNLTIVQKACANKKRFFSPIFGIIVAARLSSIKKGDEKLIEESMKYKKLN